MSAHFHLKRPLPDLHIQLIWLWMCACVLPAVSLYGQATTATMFERCLAYGQRFEGLNEEFEKNREHFGELAEELKSLEMRLGQTNQDMQFIQNEVVRKSLQQMELAIRAHDLRVTIDQLSKERMSMMARAATAAISNDAVYSQAVAVGIEGQFVQLDVAQRTTAERRFKLLKQYNDTTRHMNDCLLEEKRLVDAYIQHSDQAATRCKPELRSALRALDSAANDNYGARLARAITHGRLGYVDRATAELNELLQLPFPYSTIALAARSELNANVPGSKLSRQEVRLMNSAYDPTVQYFRARAAAALGNYAESLKLCERLMQVESHQIQSLTLASLVNSHPQNTDAKNLKSLEQAQLAYDLTGGRDWSCAMALALAHAANKNAEQALVYADKAIEQAIGDQRERCQEIRDALASGQTASWKF